MSENYSNFSCPDIRTSLFGVYTGLLLTLSCLSIILTIIVMNNLSLHGLFHANVRLTLQNFCLANILTSILLLFRGIQNFATLIFGYDIFNFPAIFCMALDQLRNLVNTVALISMSVIGFERLISTLRQKYSDPEHPSKTMKFVIGVVWMCALGYGASGLAKKKGNGTNTCYCFTSSNLDNKFSVYIFIPYIVMEVATLTSFLCVLYLNKRLSDTIMNVSRHSLQARYIVCNNISTTRSLLPTVAANAILYLGVLLLQFVLKLLGLNSDIITATNSWTVTYILISFGCFFEPLLLVKSNEKFYEAIWKKLRRLGQIFAYFPEGNKIEPACHVVSYKVHPDLNQEILNEVWLKNSSFKKTLSR